MPELTEDLAPTPLQESWSGYAANYYERTGPLFGEAAREA